MGVATAAPMQHTYNFTASGFSSGPESLISGSITATFDEASVGSGTVDAINLVIGSHVFSAAETVFEGFSNVIIFGGANCGAGCLSGYTPDFWLYFTDFNNLLNGSDSFVYASSYGHHFANSVTISAGSANVSEPVTLSLFGLGLLGLAAVRRNKQSI